LDRSPGGNLALIRGDGDAIGTSTTVVLNVSDCHEACAELRRRGVACADPVVFPGFVVYCSFVDPFGNRLQMCSPAPPVEPR
jgi:predicted enzyme related to lactoylglutathione lyase